MPSRTPYTNPPLQVGLPEHVAVSVLRIYGADPMTDLTALLRASEASMEQLTAVIVRDCFEGRWHGRMSAETARRIKNEIHNAFTPPEGTPPDPLAANAAAFNEHSAMSRADELDDRSAVVVVPQRSGFNVHDTRESRS